MRIVFLHPDLGIGGAERLVVDAGLALKQLGHHVHFLTCHHDVEHCFKETKDGSLDVTVVGDWFPRSFFGRCFALCAYLRMVIAAIYLLISAPIDGDLGDHDILICDQISAPIPLLKWMSSFRNGRTPKIIFYCHFPDMLLTKRESLLKTVYRKPLDWLEEWTTGAADVILVNSNFTAGVFRKTFTSLAEKPLQVLYPTCNFSLFDRPLTENVNLNISGVSAVFLSINRYERKKNLNLALEAASLVLKKLKSNGSSKSLHLIIAGGYDDRVLENAAHYQELVVLASELGISDHISFLKSPSDATKHTLLHNCTAVLYTPENEHFGIVPLEAMYMRRPVIACNSGGPLETVIHDETGILCDSTSESFSDAMLKFVEDKSLSREYGQNGHEHVKRTFSYSAFKTQLNDLVNSLDIEN
ncbi:Alpha-1,3/1,6-mannosyltransferase ALG2 [Halotydeus destructor]|nr:Alpha-1,3/1,6-mannosyltransferase ALG2 [Halotydeus destructor]